MTRGLAIAAMLAVNNPGINPGHPGWLRHPPWSGLSVADTVFPLFLFCIGVSSAFSTKQMPSRDGSGPTFGAASQTMLRRCAILFGLGVGLSFLKQHQIVLAGVLQHIAVTSLLAWFVLLLPRRAQYAVGVALLVATGALGLSRGFAQGSTLDEVIDRFLYHRDTAEGLPVAVASVFNVLVGAWVGRWFRSGYHRRIASGLGMWAVGPLVVGLALIPWIPVNKQLWTPTFALIGTAISAAVMLVVYEVVDVRRVQRPFGWLREMGANPLIVYVVTSALAALVPYDVRVAVVRWMARGLPIAMASVTWSGVWIVLAWAIAHLLWRRRIFVKL